MPRAGRSFRCRDCDAPTRVTYTCGEGDVTLRFRECDNGHRFVTREVFDRDVRANRPYVDGRGRRQIRTLTEV